MTVPLVFEQRGVKKMNMVNLGDMVTNNWLIKIDDGYLMIDTGYPERFGSFYAGMLKAGIDIEEIRYVFLTHAHDDHAGFLGALLQNSAAKAVINKAAVEILKKGQISFDYSYTSAAAAAIGGVMRIGGREAHQFPPVPVELEERYVILDGKAEKKLERLLQGTIIETPGHTDCDISFLTKEGELFCGDAAMNGIPSKNRVSLVVNNLDTYIESWQKIIELKPIKIYPGHGSPFNVSDLKKYMYVAKQTKLYPVK